MGLFKSFLSTFRRSQAESNLNDELRFHLEKEVELNMARGMPPDEARRQALVAFGGVQQTREAVRQVRWTHLAEILAHDLRYAGRMLRKSPAFTTVAVLTLALGIGMNTAIFSLIDAVLFRTLPARHPEELVVLRWHAHNAPETQGYVAYGDCIDNFQDVNASGCSVSLPFFKAARAQSGAFSSVAAFAGPPALLALSSGGPARAVGGTQLVSGEYFQTLGIGAAVGRTLDPADDTPSAPPVLMLSYGYWQSAFGGDPSAVGKTVRLNGVLFSVVGVAEPGFTGLTPGRSYDLWLPLAVRSRLVPDLAQSQENPASWWVVVVGRTKPEFPVTQAQAAMSLLFRDETLRGEPPIFKTADEAGIDLVPAQQALKGLREDTLPPLYVLMLAAGLVLLIACANIAGLLLARAAAREKEIAIRLTLGARRGRLIIQLLTESLVLSLMGGALGLYLAHWAARLLTALSANGPYSPHFTAQIDGRVLAFTAVVSILTGSLFGLAPAFRGLRRDLTPALNASSNETSPVRSRRGWLSLGNGLVVIQVALAMVALVCAGLLVHTLANLRRIDPGFDTRNILVFGLDGRMAGYTEARADSLYRELREKFSVLPGVTSVSYSWASLLSGSLLMGGFHLPGKPDRENGQADRCFVGPGFFATMRIPLQTGRDFTDSDFVIARDNAAAGAAVALSQGASPGSGGAAHAMPLPAIVNEAFVRQFFPHVNPLGQRLEDTLPRDPKMPRGPGWQIVGVVRDAKYNDLRREINPTMYVPASGGFAVFELRTTTYPTQLVPAVREITNRADNNLALFNITTEAAQLDSLLFKERRIAQLSSFFGLLALALACTGIYGMLSYEVTRRTREIGIRMAIGAQQSDVVRLVVRQGLLVTMAGAVIGVGVSFGAKAVLGTILYRVKPGDPMTLAAVAVILPVVALAASYLPARRATRVDPMVALRYE